MPDEKKKTPAIVSESAFEDGRKPKAKAATESQPTKSSTEKKEPE